MRSEDGRETARTQQEHTVLGITAASCGLVLAALPVFLVGGLAVQIRAELGFSEAALGAAVSGAFLTGALVAPLGGRLADRIGARASVITGSSLSFLSLAGIAAGARGWTGVAVMLLVAGVGLAVTDPGLAILVARAVPADRRGLAFGVKEASIPVATLAAGVAVPLIALTVGWRWAFLLGLLPLAGVLLVLPRLPLDAVPPRPRQAATTGDEGGLPPAGSPPAAARRTTGAGKPPLTALLLVTVAAALGIGAASGVGVFLTQSAVAMGIGPGEAGLLLAAGSVAGIVARVAAGILADRHGGEQFGRISLMLALGAVTMVLGATGSGPLLILGTIGTFAGVWGWSGLLFLSLVRASPAAPGAAAGMAVAGLAGGNGLGPLAFGAVAQAASYEVAWLGSAVAAAAAAVLMSVARRRLHPGPARAR